MKKKIIVSNPLELFGDRLRKAIEMKNTQKPTPLFSVDINDYEFEEVQEAVQHFTCTFIETETQRRVTIDIRSIS